MINQLSKSASCSNPISNNLTNRYVIKKLIPKELIKSELIICDEAQACSFSFFTNKTCTRRLLDFHCEWYYLSFAF